MEIFLVLVFVAIGLAALWYYNTNKTFDANKDGKVNFADVKPVAQEVAANVVKKADVNKDGKVDVADAKVVATKAKKAVKTATTKTKAAVKAKTARKPKMTVVK